MESHTKPAPMSEDYTFPVNPTTDGIFCFLETLLRSAVRQRFRIPDATRAEIGALAS
jgi:hypothetical protein